MAKRAQRFGNLPAEAQSFVGRRDELAEARRKLTAARLVSLVGLGGVGKTRLAVRIATDLGRGFPGGAWLVELATVRDPALVANTVMAALGLRDQAATEPVDLLRSYLRDKELLLVLDNCEHLLDVTARLIDDVLRVAPGVRVVATSREPLSVAGEHVLPVPPLDLPSPHADSLARTGLNDAVRLFVERAAEATGRFELTEANRAAVVDVCRRLDGLPLAIELAAVRIRALSPDQIRGRLSDRFELLTGSNRTALPRHQTLHTAIEWSYNLLTPAEQTLFMRLGVFAGRYTLDDVEAVCCSDDLPAAQALDLLSALLDKSLLGKEDTVGLACYRLPETMREYARRKLRESGDADAVELRCGEHLHDSRYQRRQRPHQSGVHSELLPRPVGCALDSKPLAWLNVLVAGPPGQRSNPAAQGGRTCRNPATKECGQGVVVTGQWSSLAPSTAMCSDSACDGSSTE